MGSCPSPPSCQRSSLGEEFRTGDTVAPTLPTTELAKVKTKGSQDGCPPRCPGLWPVEQHSHLVKERVISPRPSPGEDISGETSGRPVTAPRGLLGEALNLATQGIWGPEPPRALPPDLSGYLPFQPQAAASGPLPALGLTVAALHSQCLTLIPQHQRQGEAVYLRFEQGEQELWQRWGWGLGNRHPLPDQEL